MTRASNGLTLALTFGLCACAGSSSQTGATPASQVSTARPRAATGPVLGSLRDVDWTTLSYPGLDLNGDDELGAPHYGDLTGDGREEAALEGMAMIPDANSYVNYVYVFTLDEGASEARLLGSLVGGDRADGALRLVGLDAEGLHVARSILGPDDAMCCPSAEQHETWVWDGSELTEEPERRRVEAVEE